MNALQSDFINYEKVTYRTEKLGFELHSRREKKENFEVKIWTY